jgi:hypothetical protein
MSLPSLDLWGKCFEVIVDKGCLDCLFTAALPSPLHAALAQIHRLLTPDGTFIMISSQPEQFRMKELCCLDWKVNSFSKIKTDLNYLGTKD